MNTPVARAYNKALHQTRRRGVPASRAVVEGRLAGEGWCWTDRGTDRSAFVPPPSAVADAPAGRTVGNVPAWAELVRSIHQPRPALGTCPGILQHPVGPVCTQSFPSASSWLGTNDQTTNSGFPVVTPRPAAVRPSNKGLERTRRVGVPASRAVIRVSPCRSTPC
jgi:hypothetical protein